MQNTEFNLKFIDHCGNEAILISPIIKPQPKLRLSSSKVMLDSPSASFHDLINEFNDSAGRLPLIIEPSEKKMNFAMAVSKPTVY